MINYATYKHETMPDVLVIEASGKLDTTTADFMLDCIQGYIEHGDKKVVIDCEDLNIITSVGLGMLVRANKRMKESGGAIAIANAQGLVADSLRLVHFDRLFGLHPSIDDAAASLKSD
ncbi:MAG: STAS domain-containing protein [Planctomycetota bacterium]